MIYILIRLGFGSLRNNHIRRQLRRKIPSITMKDDVEGNSLETHVEIKAKQRWYEFLHSTKK